MESRVCLNCKEKLIGPYCHQCGQAASTHRFTIKSVFSHEFMHSVFHLNQGILYTFHALFTVPGHAVREYLEGKRKKLLNFFTLIVILILSDSILKSLTTVHLVDLASSQKEFVGTIEDFRIHFPKIVVMGFIPIRALISFLLFRKAKKNYAEHIVLNTYLTSVTLIFNMVFTVISIFYTNIYGLKIVNNGILLVSVAYEMWFYYQYFSAFNFPKSSLWLRSFICAFILILFITIILALIMTYFKP